MYIRIIFQTPSNKRASKFIVFIIPYSKAPALKSKYPSHDTPTWNPAKVRIPLPRKSQLQVKIAVNLVLNNSDPVTVLGDECGGVDPGAIGVCIVSGYSLDVPVAFFDVM